MALNINYIISRSGGTPFMYGIQHCYDYMSLWRVKRTITSNVTSEGADMGGIYLLPPCNPPFDNIKSTPTFYIKVIFSPFLFFLTFSPFPHPLLSHLRSPPISSHYPISHLQPFISRLPSNLSAPSSPWQ